jgi:cold shock CspA family protein
MDRTAVRMGTVSSFDDHEGWGEITGDDGVVFGFHCASIADGSRTVAVGARVRFGLLPKLGRVEAARVEPV